jgi:hypothetical protein
MWPAVWTMWTMWTMRRQALAASSCAHVAGWPRGRVDNVDHAKNNCPHCPQVKK